MKIQSHPAIRKSMRYPIYLLICGLSFYAGLIASTFKNILIYCTKMYIHTYIIYVCIDIYKICINCPESVAPCLLHYANSLDPFQVDTVRVGHSTHGHAAGGIVVFHPHVTKLLNMLTFRFIRHFHLYRHFLPQRHTSAVTGCKSAHN